MTEVSIRDLRTRGGEIVDRVVAGEHVTITRAGERVAEVLPLPRPALKAEVLLARWRRLPPLDPADLRRDLDQLISVSEPPRARGTEL